MWRGAGFAALIKGRFLVPWLVPYLSLVREELCLSHKVREGHLVEMEKESQITASTQNQSSFWKECIGTSR